jgi:hypothetical protein
MPNQCDPAHAQSQGPSGSPSSEACASAAFCCCCTSSATSSNIPAKPYSKPPRALPSRALALTFNLRRARRSVSGVMPS